MKRFRRIISLLLVLVLTAGIAASLASCSTMGFGVTTGEWLNMVVDKFGITGYQSETPHIEAVKKDNSYFSAVQAAYEWNIIDEETELDLDGRVTKGLVANTLVRAVGMDDLTGFDCDDIAQFAVDNAYVDFESYRGRTDNIRFVSSEEAQNSLDKAFGKWANYDFGLPQEKVSFSDDVVILGAKSSENSENENNAGYQDGDSNKNATQFYDSETSNIENFKRTWLSENVVAVPENVAQDLKPGDTYILPDESGQLSTAYKVEKITNEDGFIVITNTDEDVTFEETVKEMDISGTYEPDLTESVIVDGLGNTVSSPTVSDMSSFSAPTVEFASYHPGETEITNMAKGNISLSFEVDGFSVKGKVSESSVSFTVSGEFPLDKAETAKLKVSQSYEIKDLKVSQDYDYKDGEFSNAYAKLDYTTVEKTGGELSITSKGSFAPEYTNGNGKFLTNFKRAIYKNTNEKGAKSIKICSIKVAGTPGVGLNLDVKIKISLSGKIELVVTTNNVKGIQLKSDKIRYIKDQKEDVDLSAQGKAEATAYIGLSFRVLWFNLIGFGVEGGIGCKVTATAHISDTVSHTALDMTTFDGVSASILESTISKYNGQLYNHDELGQIHLKCDTCLDIVAYFILKLTLDNDCVLSKFSLKNDLEIIIKDDKNAQIESSCGHWEDGKKVSECTRKYQEVKEEESTDDTTGTSKSEEMFYKGELIHIDTYFISLLAGETYQIRIDDLPKGYELSDIEYISANPKVATVSSSGLITAVSGGSIEVKIKTKDNKYSTSCSVYVPTQTAESFGGGNGGGGFR